MNYGQLYNCDIANGPGMRVSLFVSGCRHHCKGCFNKETWDFNYGEPFTEKTMAEIIKMLKPDYINGITILGGEPFEKENQQEVLTIVKKVKEIYSNKNIWIYSGFTYEELINSNNLENEILNYVDVLVDGKFIEEQKNVSLKFRGSENQRIIEIKKSQEA